MTNPTIKNAKKALADLKKELKVNPDIVYDLLVQAKIITKDGQLTKQYKQGK